MNKRQFKIAIGFGAEMVFFVLTGIFIVANNIPYIFISLLFAIIMAGYVGKLIEEEAIEKYKGVKQ